MMSMASRARIMLVSGIQDREIDRIRNKLRAETYHIVGGREACSAVLEGLAQRVSSVRIERILDLIGHSVEHCFLQLGDWILDERAPAYFGGPLRDALAALQVARIRLLGCSTATTERSWTVIREIANCVGNNVEVFGTRRLLDDGDYNADGFIGHDAITGGNAIVGVVTPRPLPLDTLVPANGRATDDRGTIAEHTCFAATQYVRRSDAADIEA